MCRNEFQNFGRDLEVAKERDNDRYNKILDQLMESYRQCGTVCTIWLFNFVLTLNYDLEYLCLVPGFRRNWNSGFHSVCVFGWQMDVNSVLSDSFEFHLWWIFHHSCGWEEFNSIPFHFSFFIFLLKDQNTLSTSYIGI